MLILMKNDYICDLNVILWSIFSYFETEKTCHSNISMFYIVVLLFSGLVILLNV